MPSAVVLRAKGFSATSGHPWCDMVKPCLSGITDVGALQDKR